MHEKLTTSIVLYGEIDSYDSKKWLNFYNYVNNFATEINLAPNYIGVSGSSFKSSKVISLSKIKKKLNKSLVNNEEITSLSLYNLPDGFEIAAFDYNAYICRTIRLNQSHIILTLSNEIFQTINHKVLEEDLKQFIDFKQGEIFNLSNLESPHIYATKANNSSTFKTLDVVYEF